MTIRSFVASAILALAPAAYGENGLATSAKPNPKPAPGCHHKGVAVRTFYGKAQDMQRYLADLSAQSVSSRLQIMVVETPREAKVHVFEQSSGRNYTVSSWQGATVANLRAEWDAKILASRGNSCAGADLKADLEQRGMPTVSSGSVEHLSASETFLPLVNGEAGYMRVSLYHPCD
jgi:hypothetical protein